MHPALLAIGIATCLAATLQRAGAADEGAGVGAAPPAKSEATPLHDPGELELHELQTADGTVLQYALILPEPLDPTKAYPAVLALPPGDQTAGMVAACLASFGGRRAGERGWIVVSPVAPNGQVFFQGSERLIPELLDMLQSRYRIEGGKFHIAGASNGGISAFKVAIENPQRFHSLTAFPGHPPSSQDVQHVGRLRHLRVQMFVGQNEDRKWIKLAHRTHHNLKQANVEASLTILPNEGHVLSSMSGDPLLDLLETMRPPQPSDETVPPKSRSRP